MLYKGKPITEYSKEELIKIIEKLAQSKLDLHLQHMKDLSVLSEVLSGKG